MSRRVVVCSLLWMLACGGDDTTNNPPANSDAGMADAGPSGEGERYALSYGPITIQPGQEDTQCIWLRLSNETPIKVRRIHNLLSSSSHHLIVYKDDQDTTEQTTPVPCQPFTGALNTTGRIAPIMITQRADDELVLPEGVAYTLDAHQMIKLEMHFVNATDAPLEATATVQFYRADASTIEHEADILFIGSPDVNIPAGASRTLNQFFTFPDDLDLSQSKVFAITGHTHKLGTDMQVRVGMKNGPLQSVYAPVPFLWSEPETTFHDPGFSVPAGGGFDFECSYVNTTNQTVGFGESANDEMCFFWAYYYPSQGSKVCIHTQQIGGQNGFDICCPGNSLCGLVEDYLGG
jgi:hypothetical protein